MRSLATERVLLLQNRSCAGPEEGGDGVGQQWEASRTCSLPVKRVLSLQNVFLAGPGRW